MDFCSAPYYLITTEGRSTDMKQKKYQLLRLLFALIFFFLFCLLASGLTPRISFLAKLQFIPAFLNMIAGISAASALIVGAWLLVTWLTGRWYCAVFCPLGVLIDLLDLIPFPKKKAVKKDWSLCQWTIALAGFSMAVCGVNYIFMLLDPYSNFLAAAGMLTSDFNIGMLIPLMAIVILTIWKRRFFCTAICPAGGCFNLISRHSALTLELKDNCVKCRKCEKACPAGCIDIDSGKIDNGRCIRCMKCFDQCALAALGFRFSVSGTAPRENPERREFIKRSSVAIGGAVAGGIMLKLGMEKFAPAQPFSQILPPGAGDIKRFTEKCTSCLICVSNCPADIIRPARGGDGPVSLDYAANFCQWNCNMCSNSCPTGAIRELVLEEKQRTQIALAEIAGSCIGCSKCVPECPTDAIVLKQDGKAAVNADQCIGCGKCISLCPVKAIKVNSIACQSLLKKPEVPETENEPGDSSAVRKAVINQESCFSCGCCAEVCPVNAITLNENSTPNPVDQDKCIGCGKCIKVCPAKAITLQ